MLEKEIEECKRKVKKEEKIAVNIWHLLEVQLSQTKEIVKMIEEEKNKFAETEVTEYSEGYSNGWIKACEGILIKIKGEGE